MDSEQEKIENTPTIIRPQMISPTLATPSQVRPESHLRIAKRSLLDQNQRGHKRILDFLKARPSKEWINRLHGSSKSFVKRMSSIRGMSKSPGLKFFRVPFARNINWNSIITQCRIWCLHPMNMALLVWFFFVAAGVFLLFLLMTGALNGVITDSSQRKRWTEITNQILNALFTVICLYQHPRLCHHLVQVTRWRSTDLSELRDVYCKNGGTAAGPHERVHIAFVVTLFHVTCFAQYAYCFLFWGFSVKKRPDWAVNLSMGVGIGTPIIAGLYMIYGPLGKKYTVPDRQHENDFECQVPESDQNLVLTRPVWIGGLFDLWDDLTVTCLSLCCTFCVFGWNMERLGFGNMYVHVFTFVLLCLAPFWVFNVSALMIHNETLRFLVGITGILLTFLGLLYGGYWRTQMRKRFGLPSNPFCHGYAGLSDFVTWLFCSCCALAQEVRTGNFYKIEDGELCLTERTEDKTEALKPVLAPLERERSTIMAPVVPVLV